MPYTGDAKKAYQREYMRRRRAGEPTRREPRPWEPPGGLKARIAHWARQRYRLREGSIGLEVVGGLEFDTHEEWMEACYRFKGITEARRQERTEAVPEPKPRPKECSFCGYVQDGERVLIGDDWHYICEVCVAAAAETIARKKAATSASDALPNS
jgi:ClpX C4-type zinc finger